MYVSRRYEQWTSVRLHNWLKENRIYSTVMPMYVPHRTVPTFLQVSCLFRSVAERETDKARYFVIAEEEKPITLVIHLEYVEG